MSTHLVRVLGAATVLLLAAAGTTVAAAPTSSAGRTLDPGVDVGVAPTSSRVESGPRAAMSARATTWPVGKRTGLLTTHTVTPAGAASQRFTSVSVAQYRAANTVSATVRLDDVPTAETAAQITIAFGRLSSDGASCASDEGHNFSFSTVDENPDVDNPVYDGAIIKVIGSLDTKERKNVARNARWNCAFAKSAPFPSADPNAPEEPPYDQVARSNLREYIQRPQLSITISGKPLKPSGFTEVPIRVSNSLGTIATAPGVRLTWKTTRVTVRAPRDLGSIKPGTSKRTSFFIKRTQQGKAKVTFTVRSRNYRTSVTLVLKPST